MPEPRLDSQNHGTTVGGHLTPRLFPLVIPLLTSQCLVHVPAPSLVILLLLMWNLGRSRCQFNHDAPPTRLALAGQSVTYVGFGVVN